MNGILWRFPVWFHTLVFYVGRVLLIRTECEDGEVYYYWETKSQAEKLHPQLWKTSEEISYEGDMRNNY